MCSTKHFNKVFELFFFLTQTGSFPLKIEQKRNMSVPSPQQQPFFVSVLLFFYPPSVWKNMYECMTSVFSLSLFSAGSVRQCASFCSFTSLPKNKSYLAGIVVGREITLQYGVYQTWCLLRVTFESWWHWMSLSCVWGTQHSCVVLHQLVCVADTAYNSLDTFTPSIWQGYLTWGEYFFFF